MQNIPKCSDSIYIRPVRVILRPWIKSSVSASHYLVFLVWSLNFNALLLLHCFMLKEHRIFVNCIIVVSSYMICMYPLKPLQSNSYMDQSVTYAQKLNNSNLLYYLHFCDALSEDEFHKNVALTWTSPTPSYGRVKVIKLPNF